MWREHRALVWWGQNICGNSHETFQEGPEEKDGSVPLPCQSWQCRLMQQRAVDIRTESAWVCGSDDPVQSWLLSLAFFWPEKVLAPLPSSLPPETCCLPQLQPYFLEVVMREGECFQTLIMSKASKSLLSEAASAVYRKKEIKWERKKWVHTAEKSSHKDFSPAGHAG